MSQHKDEALRAINHCKQKVDLMLASNPELGLERRLLAATLDHAIEQVEAIVEVKRVRKAKAAA